MTKAEFIQRLEDQFSGMIEGTKRSTFAEIESVRNENAPEMFLEWLRSGRDKAHAEPLKQAFDKLLQHSCSTPGDAARYFAASIKFEHSPAPVDWAQQWEYAAPVISNFRPEMAEGWSEYHGIKTYIGGINAQTRAAIFAQAIEQFNAERNNAGKPKPQPAMVTPEYVFDSLFNEVGKDRFLRAAKKAGIIDNEGNWALGERKKWVLVAAWNSACQRDLTMPGLNDFGACKSIAKHWSTTISQTTFEDFWNFRREDYSNKRGYNAFEQFLNELSRP